MMRLFLLVSIIVSFLFSQNTKESQDFYDKLQLSFKYGTKTEVLRGLSLYNEKNLTNENKGKYFEILKELMNLQSLDYDINYQLFNILKNNNQNAVSYYQALFDKILKEDRIIGDKLRLYQMLLDFMINSKDKSFSEDFKKIYLDSDGMFKDKGLRSDDTLARVIRAYREFAMDISTPDLETLYKGSTSGELKAEIIRNIAVKKDLKDIAFLKEQLGGNDADRVVKGIILVELSKYGSDPSVMSVLSEYSNNSDESLKARAIYAISQVGDPAKKLAMFEEAIRSDKESMRLQALEMAKSMMNDEIKKVLEYKKESDPSSAVRRKAKEILEQKPANPK